MENIYTKQMTVKIILYELLKQSKGDLKPMQHEISIQGKCQLKILLH